MAIQQHRQCLFQRQRGRPERQQRQPGMQIIGIKGETGSVQGGLHDRRLQPAAFCNSHRHTQLSQGLGMMGRLCM